MSSSSARKIGSSHDSEELSSIDTAPPARREAARREAARREAARPKAARPRRAARLLRLERPRLGEDRTWEHEVRSLPAHLLPSLPLATTLRIEVPGHEGAVAVAMSPDRAAGERESGAVVFDAGEWSALVTAAESDRLWPAELREICARKAKAPRWVLDLDAALAGARPDAPAGRTVGWVLDRVGAHLVSAET